MMTSVEPLINRVLDVQFAVSLQLINATSEAQWILAIEQGAIVDQTNPENEAVNLQEIVWSTSPILSQRIIVTPLATIHTFGARVRRTTGGIAADRLLYGEWEAATGAAPDSANFVLRSRLVNFDTKNNVSNATGWLSILMGDPKAATGEALAIIS